MTIELKIGNPVTRTRKGFAGKLVHCPGCIIAKTDDIIICNIPNQRGGGTVEKFDAKTGVNIDGMDFGWLDEVAQSEQGSAE